MWSPTLGGERQAVGAINSMPASPTLPVPSLFRLTLIRTAKRCEPTHSQFQLSGMIAGPATGTNSSSSTRAVRFNAMVGQSALH